MLNQTNEQNSEKRAPSIIESALGTTVKMNVSDLLFLSPHAVVVVVVVDCMFHSRIGSLRMS